MTQNKEPFELIVDVTAMLVELTATPEALGYAIAILDAAHGRDWAAVKVVVNNLIVVILTERVTSYNPLTGEEFLLDVLYELFEELE